MFHSHNILYTLHTVKIEVIWVCRFAFTKFFARYRDTGMTNKYLCSTI